jgi:hypothetical protein
MRTARIILASVLTLLALGFWGTQWLVPSGVHVLYSGSDRLRVSVGRNHDEITLVVGYVTDGRQQEFDHRLGPFRVSRINIPHGCFYSEQDVPMMAIWTSGPVWPVAAAASVLPVLLLRPAFRKRRRRHAHQCERCGYNLQGLIEPRCPECGTQFAPVLLDIKTQLN